ncbi:MAG: chemotaxis protein CheD [Armatimonadetes bacterium]|nr:chemotaxis protein CheD [Armatimonadota bacterium]
MKVTIGLADLKTSHRPGDSLCVLGLGSCLALVCYDPVNRIGGVAHTMLPGNSRHEGNPAKYVDTAVPLLVERMTAAGAQAGAVVCAVVGGATMLTQGTSALLEIGGRNIAAAEEALDKAGLQAVIKDVGGCKGRTVVLAVKTGVLQVSILGQPDRVYQELCAGAGVRR